MIRLILVGISLCLVSSKAWSYHGENGPSTWYGACNLATSLRQSPIDLQTPNYPSSYVNFSSFKFSGYDNVDGNLEINGNTVTVTITSGEPLLSAGGLQDTYRLAELHLHWGSDDSRGSEHTINGQRFPMEVHFVHYNTKYHSVSEAADKAGGFAVLGWMFRIDHKNKAYVPIINSVDQIYPQSAPLPLTDLNIRDLLGDANTYFRYHGSHTRPPCDENVIWTVFDKPITISETQLRKMRKVLASSPGEQQVYMVDNSRPIQPTNGREILYNKGVLERE